ncbi:MAG: hypothetical protein RR792_12335 [Thermomonas sp.]
MQATHVDMERAGTCRLPAHAATGATDRDRSIRFAQHSDDIGDGAWADDATDWRFSDCRDIAHSGKLRFTRAIRRKQWRQRASAQQLQGAASVEGDVLAGGHQLANRQCHGSCTIPCGLPRG